MTTDYAILRRMPKRFAVSLPNEEQRKKILEIVRIYHFIKNIMLRILY